MEWALLRFVLVIVVIILALGIIIFVMYELGRGFPRVDFIGTIFDIFKQKIRLG